MSIKIFNGIMFHKLTPTLSNIQDLLDEFRAPIRSSLKKKNAEEILLLASGDYDLQVLGINEPLPDESPLYTATHKVMFADDEVNRRTDPCYSIAIGKSSACKYLLGMHFFDDNKIFTDIVLPNQHILEYGYWDNADKPDDVSEFEWEERKDAWLGLLHRKKGLHYKPIKEIMFIMDLENRRSCFPGDDDMRSSLPSLEEREKYCANIIAIQRTMEKNPNFDNLFAVIRDSKKIFDEILEEEVKSKLDTDITLDDLNKK